MANEDKTTPDISRSTKVVRVEQRWMVAPQAPTPVATSQPTTGVFNPQQLPGAGTVAPQAPPQIPTPTPTPAPPTPQPQQVVEPVG